MSCFFSSPTDQQNLIGFDASYVLNGNYSANVNFANSQNEYEVNCNGLCRPIEISLSEGVEFSECCTDIIDSEGAWIDSDLEACFAGDPTKWIYGVVTEYEEKTPIVGVDTVRGTVRAFSDYLNHKPIHTQQFYGSNLSTVLPAVLSKYSGIPSALYSLDYVDNKIIGPIKGNSTLAEIQLLAQAGYANMFIQVGGQLTIEQWKDHNSAVELVIPSEMILNVQRASFSPQRPALVRARGGQIPDYGCGEVAFTNSKTGDTNGGLNNVQGKLGICARSGVPTPCGKVKLNNLAASKRDLLNATIEHSLANLEKTGKISDGTIEVDFDFSQDGYITPSCKEFDILVKGKRREDGEISLTDFQKEIAGKKLKNSNYWGKSINHTRLRASLQGYLPPNDSQGVSFGSQREETSQDPSYSTNQPSYKQVEILVEDTNFNSCGATTVEISNPYVFEKEHLFNMAVRKFQEVKMEENTWNIELSYIPCLKLNQVVQFTVPKKLGLTERTVTGIVGSISISHDPTSNKPTTMKVAVMDTSCLGSTTYNSGNLLNLTCGGADSDSLNPWGSAAVGLEGVSVSENDSIFVYSNGTPVIITLSAILTVGDDYEFGFSYEYINGFQPLRVNDGFGDTDLFGDGNYSNSWTAGSGSILFSWAIPNVGYTGLYRIFDVYLVKSVVR